MTDRRTGTGMPLRADRIHRYVNAFCPLCHEEQPDRPLTEVQRLSGWLVEREGRIWLERGCTSHGLVRTLYDERYAPLEVANTHSDRPRLESYAQPHMSRAFDLGGRFVILRAVSPAAPRQRGRRWSRRPSHRRRGRELAADQGGRDNHLDGARLDVFQHLGREAAMLFQALGRHPGEPAWLQGLRG